MAAGTQEDSRSGKQGRRKTVAAARYHGRRMCGSRYRTSFPCSSASHPTAMTPGALSCVLFSWWRRARSQRRPGATGRSGIQAVRPCRARTAPRCVRTVPLACAPLPPLDAVLRARPLPLQAEAGMAGVVTHTHRASVAASRAREVATVPQRSPDPVLHGPAVQRRMSRRSRRNGGVTVGRTATAWCDGPERRVSFRSCCGCSRNGLSTWWSERTACALDSLL